MWPTRVSWVLQLITDEQQTDLDRYNEHIGEMSLKVFYLKFVESK
jgi:hypothetical protein